MPTTQPEKLFFDRSCDKLVHIDVTGRRFEYSPSSGTAQAMINYFAEENEVSSIAAAGRVLGGETFEIRYG